MTNCSISYLKLLSNLVFSCTLLLFQLLDYIITLDKEKTNPFISVKRKLISVDIYYYQKLQELLS